MIKEKWLEQGFIDEAIPAKDFRILYLSDNQ